MKNFYIFCRFIPKKGVKIAISAYFDPKIDRNQLGVNNVYLVIPRVIISQKMFLEHFKSLFSKKSRKSRFFSLFYPKIRHFSKSQFGVIFSVNFFEKYKFEEFLHNLPISTLKRLKLRFFYILTKT